MHQSYFSCCCCCIFSKCHPERIPFSRLSLHSLVFLHCTAGCFVCSSCTLLLTSLVSPVRVCGWSVQCTLACSNTQISALLSKRNDCCWILSGENFQTIKMTQIFPKQPRKWATQPVRWAVKLSHYSCYCFIDFSFVLSNRLPPWMVVVKWFHPEGSGTGGREGTFTSTWTLSLIRRCRLLVCPCQSCRRRHSWCAGVGSSQTSQSVQMSPPEPNLAFSIKNSRGAEKLLNRQKFIPIPYAFLRQDIEI